tara:strand:+ start:471 stop:695 length:225 start_codon:yes stop_codon:yes gene_type:complete
MNTIKTDQFKQLKKILNKIRYFNKFADPKIISQDKNYYYIKINNGWTTEILKDNLLVMNDLNIESEAMFILSNY